MADPAPPDPSTRPEQDVRAEAAEADLKTEAERARAEAEEARLLAEKERADKAALKVQVEDLKALAATSPESPKDLQRLHLLQIQPVRDILVFLLILGVFRLGYTLRAITIPMLLALALAYLVEPVVQKLVRRRYMSRAGAAASIILIIVTLVVVPTTLGITFGVAQAITYSQAVRGNVELLQEYIKEPTPATEARLKGAGNAWVIAGKFLQGVEKGAIAPTGATGATGPTGGAPAATGEPPAEPGAAGGPPAATVSLAPAIVPVPLPSQAPTGALAAPGLPASEAAKPGGSIARSVSAWLTELIEQNMQGVGRFVARQLIGTGADAVEIILRILGGIGYVAFAIFLILFFFFFFCTGYERVQLALASLIPKWRKTRTLDLLRQMDEVIAGFVRGRLIIMACLMFMFTVGYWLIGVPAFFLVGPIVGILGVFPYVGLVSIPVSIALMWFNPHGPEWQQTWWWIVFAPIGLYALVQTIDDYVLTPLIQGKTTQMDMPTILFAVLAGGIIAGFYGILLAIPAAACLKILLRESFWPRFRAWAEGRVKDFLPVSRYDPTETAASTPPATATTP